MLSMSEYRHERETERESKRENGTARSHARFLCSHLVVSIEHYLFDETETRTFSSPLNIQL